ncbi:MAG: DUF1302 family protein, partial [Deltaproteobacteria bacterium]|nr:DUF1302 family protein [Deltaproteobacteria bacterium]
GRSYLQLAFLADYLWFGNRNATSDLDLHVDESFLHWEKGPLELRLGKQIVRWGKTDQISPVDNLNHQDLRLFVIPDLEERKMPDWMLRARYFLDSLTLEGVYLPFFKADEVDYFGSDWAYFKHFKQDMLRYPLPPAIRDFVADLDVDEDTPAWTLANGQYGARLAATVGDVDLAASYFYGWNTQPYFSSFPLQGATFGGSFKAADVARAFAGRLHLGEDIEVDYHRCQALGFEFETTVNTFGVRGEVSYVDQRPFLTDRLLSTDKPVFFYVLGIDYLGMDDWYANLQFAHQVINSYDDEILYFKHHNTALNGELRKNFCRGDLEASLRYHCSLSDNGYFLKPKLVYKPVPDLELTVGCCFFGGDEDTYLGVFRDNDVMFTEMTWNF